MQGSADRLDLKDPPTPVGGITVLEGLSGRSHLKAPPTPLGGIIKGQDAGVETRGSRRANKPGLARAEFRGQGDSEGKNED
jgi:hypothetical protein